VNSTNSAKPIVRQLRIMALALGLWAGLVRLFATQFVLVRSYSWREAFPSAMFSWVFGFYSCPPLLCFGFPFERSRVEQRLGVHLLGCVLVGSASQLAFRHFIPSPVPQGEKPRHQTW